MPKVEVLISTQGKLELYKLQQELGNSMNVGGERKTRPSAVLRVIKRMSSNLLKHILAEEFPKCRCKFEVSLLICDDDYITQLNLEYFHRNRPTDVISFPQLSSEGLNWLKGAHECDPDKSTTLGDIVISIGAVIRQAKRYRHLQIEELMRLIAHGMLHLLGYSDETIEGRRAMAKREIAFLYKCGF